MKPSEMNVKIKIIAIFIFLLSYQIHAQKMHAVAYESQSEIKIYVVAYESQCDLKIYKVDYQSQAKGNEGLWYFTEYSSQADKKIFVVDYESQADLKIYFVEYKSQAGWRNKQYIHLLY